MKQECNCVICRATRAIEMAHGLMSGDPATFKAGYSLENAAIAAAEVHGVDREILRRHLEFVTSVA